MHENAILSVGLGSDDEAYRALVETVVKAVAAALGVKYRFYPRVAGICWMRFPWRG